MGHRQGNQLLRQRRGDRQQIGEICLQQRRGRLDGGQLVGQGKGGDEIACEAAINRWKGEKGAVTARPDVQGIAVEQMPTIWSRRHNHILIAPIQTILMIVGALAFVHLLAHTRKNAIRADNQVAINCNRYPFGIMFSLKPEATHTFFDLYQALIKQTADIRITTGRRVEQGIHVMAADGVQLFVGVFAIGNIGGCAIAVMDHTPAQPDRSGQRFVGQTNFGQRL